MTDADSLVLHRTGDVKEVRRLLLDIHVEVRGQFGLMSQPFNAVERYDERLTMYASRPGWETLIGYYDGEPVGYVFGAPLAPNTAWWSAMREQPPADFVQETGSRTFAVQEILVRASWRGTSGTGTSRILHDALLASRQEQRATLLVDPTRSDGRLKAVYESWGYEDIGPQQPFPDSPVFATMVRDPLHR